MRKVKFKVIEELKDKERKEYLQMLEILLLMEIQMDIVKVFNKSLDFKEVK